MIWVAIVSASAALFVASFTLFITAPWLRNELEDVRRELEVCARDRANYRLQLQLIVSALVGLLPEPRRLELLRRVGAATEPIDDEAA